MIWHGFIRIMSLFDNPLLLVLDEFKYDKNEMVKKDHEIIKFSYFGITANFLKYISCYFTVYEMAYSDIYLCKFAESLLRKSFSCFIFIVPFRAMRILVVQHP